MIRLSASAFDVVWHDLGLGRVPVPLAVPSVGATEAERAAVREEVYRGLTDRGLFDGRLAPDLETRLRLLDGGTRYVACEALVDMTADAPFRAVTAVRGRGGVLAVQPERTVGLSAIREGELVSAIVAVLPELSAGPGFGVNLPATAFDSTADSGSGWDSASASVARQVEEVAAIQARPVFAAGQFSVYARDNGRLTRCGGLTWFDTDAGAYSAGVSGGRGGQDWVNVAPVDGPRLVERVLALFG
ncbi:ESX secretion-associated protein EspG [Amycolatopsis rhabdoformis]|uniref:ESX secretion-associated protein EspG n=1 Tax=Amycolatopsis rhabdoformis TaxID=1448059 RepID=A0ABZ1ILB3_9PSEU|nr:ESX secretion-associated protein EspG [Amycolatopsis rhabdoformis]WSE34384.1 ESX secretion-associated protein EspG [Amycolatopsis rhabdoformis]